jgi:hypothetical protein
VVSADLPLHNAAYAVLTTGGGLAALVAAGVADPAGTNGGDRGVTTSPRQGQPGPYVEFGSITEAEGGRSSTTRSAELTLTCVVRAPTMAKAKAVAAVLVERLARRLTLAGTPGDSAVPYVTEAWNELSGPTRREPGEPPVFAHPVRTRYRIHQTAPSSE